MKWSEVIMVRSAGRSAEALAAALRQLMSDLTAGAGHAAIRVFQREKLDSDFCIVLFHKAKKTNIGGSPAGLRIAAALREFGQVNHTVWTEMIDWQGG